MDSLGAGASRAVADSVEWLRYVAPNGENETYLRYLQMSGAVAQHPWSVRGFSQADARRMAVRLDTHPWSRSGSFTSTTSTVFALPLTATTRINTAFPYGSNDGAVWAGRGATASITAGVGVRAGPFSLTLSPVAFIAQNASFDLLDHSGAAINPFADGLFPDAVDRPQRFGENAYGRLDPGNSTVALDAGPFAGGISTANLSWGPMERYPYVLGTNAPGFLHAFFGTSRPANVWVGKIHARLIWGRLEQSDFSPVVGEPTYVSPVEPGTRRFGSGLSLVLQPRGVPGLELGVARFFHLPWPREGIPASYMWKPFENVLKVRLRGSPAFVDPGTTAENQLVSAFARWVFPGSGFEMYAEYGRDDHSWDKRDFAQEPDHSRSYGLGLRKTLRVRPDRVTGVTVEMINFQLPHLTRTGRFEGGIYAHGVMRQGHTHRGQLLGADVGVGAAAGASARWDSYTARGRSAFSVHRVVRQERGAFFATGVEDPRSSDVQYSVEAEQMRRLRRLELTTALALIHGFNRNFRADATSLSVIIGLGYPARRGK